MTHYWRVKKFLPERFGEQCRVVKYGKKRAVLIEFADGMKYRTVLTFIRRIK